MGLLGEIFEPKKLTLHEKFMQDMDTLADEYYPPKELIEQVQSAFNNQSSLFRQQRGGKPTEGTVREAINKRQRAWIYYKSTGNENHEILEGYRLIEPYALGRGLNPKPNQFKPKENNTHTYLRAFVVRELGAKGGVPSVSLTNDEPYWRMFRLDKIDSWKTIPSFFYEPREGYNPRDKDMISIIASAQF